MTAIDIGHYLDPVALGLVGLGCLFVAIVQNGLQGVGRALAAAAGMVRPTREAERARLAAVMIEDMVRRRGVSCADRSKGSCAFTRDLSVLMSDQPGFDAFQTSVEQLVAQQDARRTRAVMVWNDIADAAPALGMLGTVLGLVQMFGRMDTAEGLGTAMALCLLTSLYGLIFAHLLAGPIARRLEMLGEQEADWQAKVVNRMLVLARHEYPERAARTLSIVPDPAPDAVHGAETVRRAMTG